METNQLLTDVYFNKKDRLTKEYRLICEKSINDCFYGCYSDARRNSIITAGPFLDYLDNPVSFGTKKTIKSKRTHIKR